MKRGPMPRIELTGVPMRVLLYFARNPDEELLSNDISAKWGGDLQQIAVRLSRFVELSWLEIVRTEPTSEVGGGVRNVYGAGPALRAAIGVAG
jgi:hypothetical protein